MSRDPLKVRRSLAVFTAFYALVVWPNLLVAYKLRWGLPDGIVDKMLLYIGSLSTGPIGAYLWAAHSKQKNDQEKGTDDEPSHPVGPSL